MLKLLLVVAFAGVCLAEVGDEHFASRVSQNYEVTINDKIVQQITYELQASYVYQAYGHYFARADVALPGFAKWFEKAAQEERAHATGLLEYINKRGGAISLTDINLNAACSKIGNGLKAIFTNRQVACICYFMSHKKELLTKNNECAADRSEWKNGLWAMEDTLALERFVNEQLLELHDSAQNDPHLSHVLEHAYLDEQVDAIKQVADYIRQLERVGSGLGEYTFDKNL